MPRRNVNDMVREAKARIEELSVEQLQAEIETGGVTLIDIRDPREQWDKAAIPGVRSVRTAAVTPRANMAG